MGWLPAVKQSFPARQQQSYSPFPVLAFEFGCRRGIILRSAAQLKEDAGGTANDSCVSGAVLQHETETGKKAACGKLQATSMKSDNHDFTGSELRKLRSLRNPDGIQRYLDDLPYHLADTAWSPRRVLRENTAHCLEGAIFAAAALRANGYPPLIVDFEAEHDTDHVLAVFRERGLWGAIAKSNYTGCRYREPVYRSLRELAMSYFNIYFNMRRQRSLRTFSRPVNLKRFDDQQWMTTEKPIWFITYYLVDLQHYKLLPRAVAKRLHRVDERLFQGETLGKVYK